MTNEGRSRPRRAGWRTRCVACCAFAWFLCAAALAAQGGGDATVKVQLSTGVARPGERVVLSIVVENARAVRVTSVPTVEGLVIDPPEGPSTGRYTTIVNRRVTERIETTYRCAIRGAAEGQFEIPPFELSVDGATVRTRPVTLKILRDMRGENVGFFQITPSSNKVVEGQPFTLELRFGWDRSTGSNYADLSLPWWGTLRGALELDMEQPPKESGRVLVNGEIQVPVEQVASTAGSDRVEFRMLRSFLPTRAGKLDFPTSFMEFGRSSDRGFFGARKLSNFFVRAEPFELDVVPLPREGQPYDYSGAVGSLDALATPDTRDVLVGDSIKLTVDWTGSGNLEFFEAPDLSLLDAFGDFRVYGTNEEKSFGRRRVVYDIAPISADVDAIPPVPLSVFDLESEAYITLETDAIPIRVRALEHAASLEGDAEPGESFTRDIVDIDARALGRVPPPDANAGVLSDRMLFAGTGFVLVGWLVVRTAVRRRVGDPAGPLERRRRRARRKLAQRLRGEDDPKAVLASFTSYLAARTREADEAWTGRDVTSWRREHGGASSEATGDELADLLARLEAAVYGGGARVEKDEVLRAADRLARTGL